MSNKLKQAYYDITNPGGFGGVSRLMHTTKSNKGQVSKWLSTQPSYSLNKTYRKHFPTRHYRTSGLNDLWQMDLMEMIPYAKVNKGYKYVLVVIDVFSRFAYALPLKSKTGIEVAQNISKLFESKHPLHVQTDLGKEFCNKLVSDVFKKNNIIHYSVYSQFKAAIVERFIRTLRDKLKRYFTYTNKKIWYTVLDQIVDTYNKTIHRSLNGKSPNEINKNNESDLWLTRNRSATTSSKKSIIKLMDYVRISKLHQLFIKNFDENWSEEIYRVIGIDKSVLPYMYIIEDLNHELIKGKFYKEELQVIHDLPKTYRIESILKSYGKGRHKQYLVKWYGYPSQFNSWIHANQVDNE